MSYNRAAQMRWRMRHPEKLHENHIRRYGLSLAQYAKLFDAQFGSCAICWKGQHEMKSRLSVDHDHVTGKVRGLLCAVCNTRLFAIEDMNWRMKAERYLKTWRIK